MANNNHFNFIDYSKIVRMNPIEPNSEEEKMYKELEQMELKNEHLIKQCDRIIRKHSSLQNELMNLNKHINSLKTTFWDK